MPFCGSKLACFWRRSTRPRLVFGHFGAAKSADLGQDAGEKEINPIARSARQHLRDRFLADDNAAPRVPLPQEHLGFDDLGDVASARGIGRRAHTIADLR